jgi:hypothetical protein
VAIKTKAEKREEKKSADLNGKLLLIAFLEKSQKKSTKKSTKNVNEKKSENCSKKTRSINQLCLRFLLWG